MFSHRQVAKTYLALLHGHLKKDATTVTLPIARDLIRRTRMTTRRADGRTSHISTYWTSHPSLWPLHPRRSRIETGAPQIRVHAQSLDPRHGDTLYGAPHLIPTSPDASSPATSSTPPISPSCILKPASSSSSTPPSLSNWSRSSKQSARIPPQFR
jgi:23S rRNA pseudouridine1911/1915/1917 synthase